MKIFKSLCFIAISFGFLSAFAEKRPNIILIMSDDMGYSDIGCFGGDIKTPVLDGLAAEGLKFTQFYNCARCCPTRAALLTGLYPHQASVGHMLEDLGQDGYRGELNKNCVTIAEVLSGAGYNCYAAGKWHVTNQGNLSHMYNWPLQRGFKRYYGTTSRNYFNPKEIFRGNQIIALKDDKAYQVADYYYNDAVADNAIMFIDEARKAGDDKPFFLYLPFKAAHWPMQAPQKYIEAYKGKYDKGWDVLRKEKFARMQTLGLINPSWRLSEDASVDAWEDAKYKDIEKRCMETYAGIVTSMDDNIGKLVEYLRQTGQLENTVIFFLQDNGGCAETIGRADMSKLDVASVGTENSFIAYGKGWAHLSNTPFKEYKHWVHEGGISTPLIVYWPQGLKDKGQTRNQPGFVQDIMPTILELAAAKYPAEFNGNKIKPCAGLSLVSAFDKDMPYADRAMFWEHEGNRAARQGKWKAVYKANPSMKQNDVPLSDWELYDIESDRTETQNLAKENPEVVARLAKMWEDYAAACGVKPWPQSLTETKRKKAANKKADKSNVGGGD